MTPPELKMIAGKTFASVVTDGKQKLVPFAKAVADERTAARERALTARSHTAVVVGLRADLDQAILDRKPTGPLRAQIALADQQISEALTSERQHRTAADRLNASHDQLTAAALIAEARAHVAEALSAHPTPEAQP